MLRYLIVFFFVLFASGLDLAEEYNCIKYANPKSGNIAIPVCREECIGRAPDCKPNCYDKCPEHSKCVEPEICKCDKGYVKNGPDTNMTCNLLVCPQNSQKVNDTTCKCLDGYQKVEMNAILQSCEPICEPSCPDNSFCASPNKCECDKGYFKNGPDTNMICNLLVCPQNSQKVNDTTCKCLDGYQKVEMNAILQSCEPICEPSCPDNSFCASPNKCECDKGYVKNGPDTNMTCNLLVCPQNSQKVNDTTCKCLDGYQKVEMNAILQSCEPICEPSCPDNSFCASPNKCECDKGYVKNGPDTNMTCNLLVCPQNSQKVNDTTCKCLDGYQKVEMNAILQSCEPICEPSCPDNSFCASPNKCECDKGYVKNGPDTNMTCNLLVCPQNSQKVNDTTCKCLDGYQKVEMNAILQSCEPICEPSCPDNSFCASPNKCECVGGYEIDEMSDDDPPKLKHCKPVCYAECPENSVCVSPDVCKCNPGYNPTMNKFNTLASCLEDSFTETHIIIYSFLICSVIFTIVTVIAMIVICVRKKNPAEVPDTRSWHTSFASYAEYELNENINNNFMGKN